ncbi:MAG TPA: FAD-dependent oxidoreductase [Bdellovibrionota bacterium]|nr:FAD-dependent oxidoreductase [Bdellovibrionota bacterium]
MHLAVAASELLCTVSSFKMLTATVFELKFDSDRELLFKPGQFISLVIPGLGPHGRDLRRAYSIASAPGSQPLELCIKRVSGPGSRFLSELRPGDRFRAFAPYGDFVFRPKPARFCFVTTGTGIAPVRSMLLSSEYQSEERAGSICLLGVREEGEILFQNELSSIPGLRFVPCISQPGSGWTGFRGRVSDYVRQLGSEFPWTETEFYLCGNSRMISDLKAILSEKGVQKSAIYQEIYYR